MRNRIPVTSVVVVVVALVAERREGGRGFGGERREGGRGDGRRFSGERREGRAPRRDDSTGRSSFRR